jgi:hypothetical protein
MSRIEWLVPLQEAQCRAHNLGCAAIAAGCNQGGNVGREFRCEGDVEGSSGWHGEIMEVLHRVSKVGTR